MPDIASLIFKAARSLPKSLVSSLTVSIITLSLPQGATKEAFKNLSQFFDGCAKGETKVYLEIAHSKMETPYRLEYSAELPTLIQKIIPESQIKIT